MGAGGRYTDALHLRRMPPSLTIFVCFFAYLPKNAAVLLEVSSWHLLPVDGWRHGRSTPKADEDQWRLAAPGLAICGMFYRQGQGQKRSAEIPPFFKMPNQQHFRVGLCVSRTRVGEMVPSGSRASTPAKLGKCGAPRIGYPQVAHSIFTRLAG